MDTVINWLEPWDELCTQESPFENEFYNEVGELHILYGKRVTAIGRRYDCNDILFQIHNSKFGYAVVHLTYSLKIEENPSYPCTTVYKDLNEWINSCMIPDHSEYILGHKE